MKEEEKFIMKYLNICFRTILKEWSTGTTKHCLVKFVDIHLNKEQRSFHPAYGFDRRHQMLMILVSLEAEINGNHHHHHHLFLKRPFLTRSARVRRLPRYEASPHIPEHRTFRVQTKLVRVFFYTFSPCPPTPAHTSHPCHHHISTGQHPIISVLTYHIIIINTVFIRRQYVVYVGKSLD